MCLHVFNLTDDESPSFMVKFREINHETDAGSASAIVWWTTPVARDNSRNVTLRSSHHPGRSYPMGITTVTYIAEDSSSNNASFKFIVKVSGKQNS